MTEIQVIWKTEHEFKPSVKQLDEMAHALGISLYDALIRPKMTMRKLSKEFYRNYFQIDDSEDWNELCKNGFAGRIKNNRNGSDYYYVLEFGTQYFQDFFNKHIAYKMYKDRDLEYLKFRINFYCEWHKYHFHSKFIQDNAQHIIFAYLTNWAFSGKQELDVIKTFDKDLRAYKKRGLLTEQY